LPPSNAFFPEQNIKRVHFKPKKRQADDYEVDLESLIDVSKTIEV